MAESLTVTAPATSANLGPGFDCLAVALDLANAVVVTRRPGPLEVRVTGEGSGELPADAGNLVCRALATGLGDLDGLLVECRNRVPLGRGLGSSAAATCAGLVAANALGALRWSPDEMLARATAIEGHADNAAACLNGGLVAVGPGSRARQVPVPDELTFVAVIPAERVSTSRARAAMPASVPTGDAALTLAHGIGLALVLSEGRLDELPEVLHDRLHEPYRAPLVPGIEALRALVDGAGCLGVTISGSGPTVLLWCRTEAVARVTAEAEAALAAGGLPGRVRPSRPSAVGVRARWTGGADLRLARAVG